MNQITIPERLRVADNRFILVGKREKIPLEEKWQKTANYPFNDPQLIEHISKGGNYGVVGGYNNLVFVDADNEEIKKVMEADMPQTYTVQTGRGGRHYYFQIIDEDKKTRALNNPINSDENWGHIKGIGGFVVGPNSIHPNGNNYSIVKDIDIASIKMSTLISGLQDFIKSDADNTKREEYERAKKMGVNLDSLDILKVVDTVGLLRRGEGYQGPHPIHGSTTGTNFHVSPSKNVWHCFRHSSGGGPLNWIAVEHGIIRCDEAVPGVLREERFKEVLKIAEKEYGLKIPKKKGKEKKEDPYEYPATMAEEIMEKIIFKTTMDTEETYYYNDGIYHEGAEMLIKKVIDENDPEKSSHYANEVIFHIKARTYTARTKFNEDPNQLPLKNGVFNLTTMTLSPHSPDNIYTVQLPIIYDETKDCPLIKKFISEIVASQDTNVIQEIIGYCLLRANPLQKSVMFIGDGANGKSTLMEVVRQCLGSDNVVSVPLQDLDQNRFASSMLYGKLANIYADLPDKSLFSTGKFKMLVGEDLVPAEKKFQGGFCFMNYAKLIFSCNKLPQTRDDSMAFYRRWIILNFPNAFSGNKADKILKKKLTTSEELSGLFNWAILGLKRLLINGEFSYSFGAEEIREMYDKMSDPLKAFVMDQIEESGQSWISKEEFYARYIEYCKSHSLPSASKTVVGRELGRIIPIVREEKRTTTEGRKNGWSGIIWVAIKEEKNEEPPPPKFEEEPQTIEGYDEETKL